MPSFDTKLDPNIESVGNAVDTTAKEIGTRFDFKGTSAAVEFKKKEKEVIVFGDSDFQIDQVRDVLFNKLTKQKVDIRFMDIGKVEKIGGDKVKQVLKVKAGIEAELAKKIVKVIKDSKMKVNASIQGEEVRIQGNKRDDLQAAMALLKKEIDDVPLSFDNFRD
jgi:cyclic-di-GMP-binding protein